MSFCPPLNMICQKVTVSRNEWSDNIMGVTISLACHFRQIDTLARATHGELYDADAMVWFSSTTNIENGDTILFDSVYYQIEKIVQARRLGSDNIEFIKCELKIVDLGIS